MKKMALKVGTLCSGYDSQCMALDRLKANFPLFDYELEFWSEIDRYAKIAHNAVFPQWSDRNLGDMTTIDWSNVGEVDLLTYSTPCTDISQAGLQRGFELGSGTRSSILWNVEDAIRELRPRYLLMENVPALVSKKFLPSFKKWQGILASYGYSNYTSILDASDYGVPQHRERVFMVSILGDCDYNFPAPYLLQRRLRDVLETDVEESFYLSDKMLQYFYRVNADITHGHKFTPKQGDDIAFTIRCSNGQRVDDNFIKVKQIGNLVEDKGVGFKNPQRGRVYSDDGLDPTLNTCGGLEIKIQQRPHGFNKGGIIDIALHNIVVGSMQAHARRDTLDGVSPTITAACGMGGGQTPIIGSDECIRKLTPRECFRLMDLEESDIDRIQATGISRSQQYKLAGNSIVISCLYHIFRKLFIETGNESPQLKLF